jgi:hypothetical protein
METVEKKPIDISQLSAKELREALAAKEAEKSENREAYKALVAEAVPRVFEEIMYASSLMQDLKARVFEYFKNVMLMKAQVYEIKEKQASHTFTNDKYSITIGYRQTDGWDDSVTAGIAKVSAFLQTLSKDQESAMLVDVINSLLKKDAKNNLKANRVIELKQYINKFNNEDFSDGVEIIINAYKPARSSWFIEANVMGNDGKWQNVPLSMSSVDFPDGFEFNFFSNE